MGSLNFSLTSALICKVYTSEDAPHLSIVEDRATKKYNIEVRENGLWQYPIWKHPKFDTVTAAQNWLSDHDWKNATVSSIRKITAASVEDNLSDFELAMNILGFTRISENKYELISNPLYVVVSIENGEIVTDAWNNSKYVPAYQLPKPTSSISKFMRMMDRLLRKYKVEIVSSIILTECSNRENVITAAISTKDLTKNMVKVKSSNVWSYAMNVRSPKDKFGDVLVQFKGPNGGPGDVYIYYDVPVLTYRRWHSAQSKGHYFWKYIRNYFKYSKLTGDKRGKLANAVN